MRIRNPEIISKLFALRRGGRLPAELVDLFVETGALLQGHFRLQSGLHSEYFLRVGQLISRSTQSDAVTRLMTDMTWVETEDGSELVCFAGNNAARYIAEAVAKRLAAQLVISEVDNLRRPTGTTGWQFGHNERVLIVTDVVTTGASLLPLIERVKVDRARVLGLMALVSLDPKRLSSFLQSSAIRGEVLLEASWDSYDARNCPLCKKGVPLLPGFEFN